ncbi:ribonuclease H-like domain-containing protein [Alicyclobacillus sp. ALC3]|uniref:ribonuclease H-like domain-containing protein n=1 Tax=Alicyclobacillus sp. ALC3 TaxID=2796143 RepID=UPI002378F0A5|nr:ribonuclease H-like domain-containing protein [Alicyclobacillus sp. ALC3]WDL98672.1 ribonuclease H-like domain-containing protein [Alicyclobacillus sp. ALC3]
MNRSLKERLRSLEQSVARIPPSPAAPTASDNAIEPAAPERLTLAKLGFRQEVGPLGPYSVRTLTYDLLTMHGDSRFSDLLAADLTALARVAKLQDVPAASSLRFYDTETSGLGTGAGTFPFLHAVGRIVEDELSVDQYLLVDAMDEPALLAGLLEQHFAEPSVLVSFNGRSFDWPLLQNRLVMHRITDHARYASAQIGHADLLYPSRRLWKSSLGKVSLGHLEQHTLGLTRVDDLPGKEAPARYFSWLRTGDVNGLAPVLDHNAADVCSLVVLMARVADLLSGRQPAVLAGEHVALGRWYEEWRAYDLAGACYEAAAACPDADWRALWLHALHLKRLGHLHDAARVWELMHERFADSVLPAVELAKAAEHRDKDWHAAACWAQRALDRRERQLIAQGAGISATDGTRAALAHRLERILRKARTTGAVIS